MTRAFKGLAFAATLAGALAGSGALAPALAQDKPEVRIVTAETGGAFYVIGAAIADVLYRSGNVSFANAEASTGSVENIRLLEDGQVQGAIIAANWVSSALEGKKPFEAPVTLNTILPVQAGPLFFVTLKSEGFSDFASLAGKRVAVGARGSGMEQHARTILATLGMSFDGIDPAFLGFSEGGQALREGRIDAQLQCCIPNSAFSELTELSDVQIVNFTGEERDKLTAAVPFYSPLHLAAGSFRGLDADWDGIGLLNGLMTTADTDEETVYQIARTMIAETKALAERAPQLDGLQTLLDAGKTGGAKALQVGGAPLHPGAIRALREAGYLQ